MRPAGRSRGIAGRPWSCHRCAIIAMRRSCVVWAVALFFAGCSLGPSRIQPPAPEPFPPAQRPALSATETDSAISFSIRADLSMLNDVLNDEQVIPKRFDRGGTDGKSAQGAMYRYHAEREDFAINAPAAGLYARRDAGAALRDWWKGVELSANVFVSAPLRYKIEMHPKTASVGVPTQCGGGDGGSKQGMLTGSVAIDMTPDFRLVASVADVSVHGVDPCASDRAEEHVVAEEVQKALADSVRGGLQQAVERLNTVTFNDRIEQVWKLLRKPVRLNPDAWLLFNVERVAHGGLASEGRHLHDTIQMIGKPVIVFGDEPTLPSASLPPLDPRPTARGFRVVTDVGMDYQKLSDALTDRLRGERVSNEDRSIIITEVSVRSNGGNQVVMRIDFRGDAEGHAYLVGKPRLNPLTQTLYFENLRYDAATAQQLGKSAKWLFHSSLRGFLATEAVVGVTQATKKMQNLIVPVLNQRLSPDLVMRGKLSSFQGIGVFADEAALQVRVVAEGTLDLLTSGGS
ncbi:protein of unknown function [Candidatus Nitrospira inopinata]|uniref:Uncharacterized protein n=2 Tax=Candidatus Nitrospira inopinata TaxID=1715989 RepID=A0A0S4KY45_9BACT|nr:protein of unknown function [Candidatus Nitrospira inopinata]